MMAAGELRKSIVHRSSCHSTNSLGRPFSTEPGTLSLCDIGMLPFDVHPRFRWVHDKASIFSELEEKNSSFCRRVALYLSMKVLIADFLAL